MNLTVGGYEHASGPAVIVIYPVKPVNDCMKCYQVCPYGHGAGKGDFASMRVHVGQVFSDDGDCFFYRRFEIFSAGYLFYVASCVERGVVKGYV